jgi:Prenyltransferase and squalene oxidase repeat
VRASTIATGLIAIVATSLCCVAASAQPTESHRARADTMIEKAIAYLLTQQDESGGWRVNPTGPDMPAVTGLAVTGIVLGNDFSTNNADKTTLDAIDRAAAYMLSFQQPDGGIYDQILPSYNTAICLSALAKLARPTDNAVLLLAQKYLRKLQYSEVADPEAGGGTVARVGPRHPFYGGIGYGSHGRPDNSNLHFMLQALHDAGVPADDPAIRRALVFLQRTQMVDDVNDMPYADGSNQGGFIYSTSLDDEHIGEGESKAGMLDESLDDGTVVSRLRAYGSMTYAGFKSYAYAELDPDDPRVVAALDWISRNYTLEENPGTGLDGYYYYILTFGRAMHARNEPTIDIVLEDGTIETHNWANDLIDQLESLQNTDGSFRSLDDRWMENDQVLITAYALIALQHAVMD